MKTPPKLAQLSVLTLAFALSQAFRTIPSITVNGIAEELQAGPAALALFGGVFHWSFALMQVPVGLALDIFGVRRAVIALSGFAILGGAICTFAPDMNALFLGQILIGAGCAPAFMSAIVFTSQRSAPNRKPGDWGGTIIIGNGIINRTGSPILTEGGAAGVAEDYSGGNDNADNSGTLRYVRIEFAGFDISGGAGQELNSLSSYAVGRGTTYEYIQTMSGLDDSFEYWGGAVDGRYLVSYESGDDHFDATEGYQGRNQFLISLQTQRLTPAPGSGVFSSDPRSFEIDGCDPAVSGCTMTATGTSAPYTNPTFANFTVIGTGNLAGFPSDGNGAVLRRGTAGLWINGVMGRFKGTAIDVRDAWSDTLLSQLDSLNVISVLLAQNGANYDTTANFGQAAKFAADGHLAYAATVAVDTLLGISLNPAGLDWTPKAGSPADAGGASTPAGRVTGYFGNTWVNTTYLGAADPAGPKWWLGWTAYNIN